MSKQFVDWVAALSSGQLWWFIFAISSLFCVMFAITWAYIAHYINILAVDGVLIKEDKEEQAAIKLDLKKIADHARLKSNAKVKSSTSLPKSKANLIYKPTAINNV